MKPVEITGTKGLRNDVPIERFGTQDLALATNIDIDKTGAKRRRRGYTGVYAGVVHSLWGNGAAAYFVEDDALKELRADWSAATRANLSAAALPMAYESVLGELFYSNGVDNGVIASETRRAWGIMPPVSPQASVIRGGLHPGRYLWTMTYARANQESGAPRAGFIDLATNEGLALVLPVSSDPTVVAKHVYISEPNGEALFRVGTVEAGTTEFDYATNRPTAIVCRTLNKFPPPPGQVVLHYNGRMYVGQDDTLWYSEPYELELFDLARCFLPMGARITVAGCVDGGIFVGTTSQSIYLSGDKPDDYEYTVVQEGAAFPGTMVKIDGAVLENEKLQGEVLLWATSQGLCMGGKGGLFQNLTHPRYTLPAAVKGAAGFRIRDAAAKYAVSLFA